MRVSFILPSEKTAAFAACGKSSISSLSDILKEKEVKEIQTEVKKTQANLMETLGGAVVQDLNDSETRKGF